MAFRVAKRPLRINLFVRVIFGRNVRSVHLGCGLGRRGGGMKSVAGRYVAMGEPRSGSMSKLYKALDLQRDGRHVALKLYEAKPLNDEVLAESFRRERQALRELKHPNIVEIVDEGFLDDSDTYYVVVEWLDRSLQDYLTPDRTMSASSWYTDIGRPLLEALAFAHNRSYAHRDIKPDNILISADGTPKLIDFGTSKLRRYVSYGLTLREYRSDPFSPPEHDDGTTMYARDTYAFCATMLDCLSRERLLFRADLERSLSSLPLSEQVRGALTRGLSIDPEERYPNADALLADLDAANTTRLSVGPARTEVFVEFNQRAMSALSDHFNARSPQTAVELAIADLDAGCGVSTYRPANLEGQADQQYRMLGAELSYHVKVDGRSQDRLIVLNAKPQSPHVLERQRETAYQPLLRFRQGMPLNPIAARKALADLGLAVVDFEASQEELAARSGAERLFDVWRHMLDVKYEHDIEQQDPVRYSAVGVEGNSLYFKVLGELTTDLVGQSRTLRLVDRDLLQVEISEVDVDRRELVAWCRDLPSDETKIPREGQLVLDSASNKTSLDRQRSALEAVREGSKRTARSDLGTLIRHPDRAAIPSPVGELQPLQDLDPDKWDAVTKALGARDFLLIEGPPGTGKTTVISEIILQELRRNPKARILLTSQTHVALDNAIDRIALVADRVGLAPSIIRVGRADDARIAETSSRYLLPERLEVWKNTALRRSDAFVEAWGAERGFDRKHVEIATLLEKVLLTRSRLSELDAQERTLRSALEPSGAAAMMETDQTEAVDLDQQELTLLAARDLTYVRDEQRSLRQALSLCREDLAAYGDFEASLADEDERTLRELLQDYGVAAPGLEQFRKLLALKADWGLRFGTGAEFHAALVSGSNVVAATCLGSAGFKGASDVEYDLCILDEASKATATEALVPLSRARRWILVGDLKQLPPFQDEALRRDELLQRFELNRTDVKETLFSYLLNALPTDAKVDLKSQRRMVREIGDLVSECFYDKPLTTLTERRDEELIRHLGRPVLWLSTSKLKNRAENPIGSSVRSPVEVEHAVAQLRRLQQFADAHDERYSVAVLTPYGAQVALLKRRISPEAIKWDRLSIEVNTVDAYQGREADVAIISLVRSNDRKTLGFLKEQERLNVALSRGRQGLVIIGDLEFLKHAKDPNPFRPVIGYIENRRADCLIKEAA